MTSDLIVIDEAVNATDWLAQNSQTWRSRYLAKKIKRHLAKMFKQALKGEIKAKDKDQLWRLSTLLLKNETLHPSPDELIQKALLQQRINRLVHKITILENENLLKEH